MEIEWLKDFLSLAESGNFSRSAQERRVTQPAFSRRIKTLEAWLGAELFDRGTYPTTLTPAGKRFRDHAAGLLSQLYAARDELRGQQLLPRRAIRFAAAHALALRFFPGWLRQLKSEFGPIVAKLVAANTHDAVIALTGGGCDILITYHHVELALGLEPSRYESLALGVERLLPFSPCDKEGDPVYMLPGKRDKRLPFLSYSSGAFLGRVVEMILQHAPQRPHIERCFESDLAEALKEMVCEGHGIAWLPENTAAPEVKMRRLAAAGSDGWSAPLDISLYRAIDNKNVQAEKLWRYLAGKGIGKSKKSG